MEEMTTGKQRPKLGLLGKLYFGYQNRKAKQEGGPMSMDDQMVMAMGITEEPENLMANDIHNLSSNQNNKDELYDEAVALVKRERRASTSFIQRHLKIGYNRVFGYYFENFAYLGLSR